MQDLLSYLVTNLVSLPDAVEINEEETEAGLTFNLKVDPADMGMIIGKSGQTIRAIRKLLVVRAMVENPNLRVFVNLVDSHTTPASE